MSESIELQFKLTRDDIREFQLQHLIRNRGRRLLILLGILVLVCLYFAVSFYQESGWPGALSICIPFVLFVALWWFILVRALTRGAAMNPALFEQQQYTFRTEMINMKGETFSAEVSWGHMTKLTETQNLFLLYSGPMTARILPKRAFAPEQVAAFLQMARTTEGLIVEVKS